MTSEGPHPGHEPTEGTPGTGRPAPYGDRPPMARPTTTPDFGWAPPPATQGPGDSDGWPPQENPAHSAPAARQGHSGTAVRASASVPGAIFPADPGSYAPPQQRQEPSFADPAPHAAGSAPAGPPPWRGAEAQNAPQQAAPEVAPWSPQEAWGADGQSQQAGPSDPARWQPTPSATEPSQWDQPAPAVATPAPWEPAAPAAANPAPWDSAPQNAAPSQWDSAPQAAAAEAAPWEQPATPAPASPQWEQPEPSSANSGWGAAPAPYQPAPGPGVSPSGAVPLPPQETRIPGASLAAAPPPPAEPGYAPADHPNPAPYLPPTPRSPMDDAPGDAGSEPAWGGYAPQSTPGIPEPRRPEDPQHPVTAPEQEHPVEQSERAGVSASASVPTANRIAPEEIMQPAPAAAPRVYGRPVQPEPEIDDADPQGYQSEHNGYDRPATVAPLPDFGNGHSPFGENGRSAPVNGVKPHSAPSAPTRDEDGPAYPHAPAPYGDDTGAAEPAHGTADYWPAPDADRRTEFPPAEFPGAEQDFRQGAAPNAGQPYAPARDFDADQSGFSPERQGDQRFADERFPDSQGFPQDQRFPDDQGFANQGFPRNQGFDDQRFPDDQQVNGRPPSWQQPGTAGDGFGGQQSGPAGDGFGGQQPYGAPAGTAPWDEGDPEQNRFNSFTQAAPEQQATPPAAAEAPAEGGKGGVVKPILLIIAAATLILGLAFGLLLGIGKIGQANSAAPFDPAVGSCVKQQDEAAVGVDCAAEGAYQVVSKVDAKTECADSSLPTVTLPGDGSGRVLCLTAPSAG